MPSDLILLVTLPVLISALFAGLLERRDGPFAMWCGLAGCLLLMIGTSLMLDIPALAPIFIVAPALLLSGTVFWILGKLHLHWTTVPIVALASAGANIFMARFFYVVGCIASLWECL